MPPDVDELKFAFPPEQSEVDPEAVITGSATTVTVTAFEAGSLQPVPLQFRTTRYQRVALKLPVL